MASSPACRPAHVTDGADGLHHICGSLGPGRNTPHGQQKQETPHPGWVIAPACALTDRNRTRILHKGFPCEGFIVVITLGEISRFNIDLTHFPDPAKLVALVKD